MGLRAAGTWTFLNARFNFRAENKRSDEGGVGVGRAGARGKACGGEGAAVQLGARRRVRAQVIDGPHCGPPRRAASSLLPLPRPVCARPSRLRPGRAPAPGSRLLAWPKGKSLLLVLLPSS